MHTTQLNQSDTHTHIRTVGKRERDSGEECSDEAGNVQENKKTKKKKGAMDEEEEGSKAREREQRQDGERGRQTPREQRQ